MKQDNTYLEWNKETNKLDLLWIKEEEGKYHHYVKHVNIARFIPESYLSEEGKKALKII